VALVSVDSLARGSQLLVDCRFDLADPDGGRRAFEREHIPGAMFAVLAEDLSGPPGRGGRHPLPSPAAFEAAAERLGIGAATHVVAYDRGEGGAARLWWLLRHFGHEHAAVLDGGLDAWIAAGGALETGPPQRRPAPADRFLARTRDDDTVTADDLRDRGLAIVDARIPERYRGDVEPLDPVAGHIPGARNLPFTAVAAGGRYRRPEELRELLGSAGIDGIRGAAVYCGSGVTATTLLLAADAAGVGGARLYPGSWSEWSRRGLPAEQGG
jgi:thiosulfate/3-mercaptopyruvate sulfurtransferase